MMDPGRRIAQPGPALTPRILAVPCRAVEALVTLHPGEILLDAIAARLGECRAAVLHLQGGAFGPFTYVIPALSATPDHAAFYSAAFTPPGASTIDAARITYGTRDGRPWLHCHGLWTEADGRRGAGHVIPDQTRIASPVTARAWLLDGADFVARPDPETNFTLFAPEATSAPAGPCLAIRLRPNQDLCRALEEVCLAHGLARARIRGGVASIIGAVFEDGREAAPFATEIFIRSGEIGPDAAGKLAAVVEIGLVNHRGEIIEGRLRAGANPVLMTAELVLVI